MEIIWKWEIKKINFERNFQPGIRRIRGIRIHRRPISNWDLFKWETGFQRGQYLPKDPVPSSVLQPDTGYENGKFYCDNCIHYVLLRCSGKCAGICRKYRHFKKLEDIQYLVSGSEPDFEVEYKIIMRKEIWDQYLGIYTEEIGINSNTLLSEFTDWIVKREINRRLENAGAEFRIE